MNVIRHKIWQEIWGNKARTLQIVLIIAMGAFALGMIIGSRNLFEARMGQSWRASSPAMISLAVDPAVDDAMVTSLGNIEGIQEVEGYLETTLEWRLSPADPWQPGNLIARDDYEAQTYNQLHLIAGRWPEGKTLAMEKGSDTYLGIPTNGPLYIRLNDREYVVQIEGVVTNLTIIPPSFGGTAQFYTTRDRFGELAGGRNFNRLLAGAPVYDQTRIIDLADRLQRRLEKQDIEVAGAAPPQDDPQRTADPTTYYAQAQLDGLFLILGLMAALSLILGLLLVYNTINTVISQEINQIGIMKAIGARTGQIMRIYLAYILIYGLLALIIAAPLGAGGAYGLYALMTGALNVEPGPFTLSPVALGVQVIVVLLAPLVAALAPILTGVGITVREAISSYGLTAATGGVERLLARLAWLPRLLLLALGNTFRNRWRVLLTQITLVGSGLIFMMIISVQESVAYTFSEVLFASLRFNVTFQLAKPERIERLEALTLAQPGVKAVEMWGYSSPKMWPVDRPESGDDKAVQLFGLPLPSRLYVPELRSGRWLQAGDTYAVVLNQRLAREENVTTGDQIIFDHGPHGESEWQVVGIVFDPNPALLRTAYTPRDTLLYEIRSANRASTLWIQTEAGDPASEIAVAQALRRLYELRQIDLDSQGLFFGRETAGQITALILELFGLIVALLAIMALVVGLVGGVTLSGILSLSVLERRREIGVMRAIGASSTTIAGLFISEGLLLGWLSWLIALALSLPVGYLFTQVLALALRNDLSYIYTPAGALYWLGIITFLAILASWFPAHRATRISVRESLAY